MSNSPPIGPAPADVSVHNGSRMNRTGWIVFGMVVVLLGAGAATLYSAGLAAYRNNVREIYIRGTAFSYSSYEKDKGVQLAGDTNWEGKLIAEGYIATEMLWSKVAINERAKFVVVSVPPDIAAKIGSSWACMYDDPTSLKPGAKACIAFPDGEVVQVRPLDLLNEIRRGLESRKVPFDESNPGLQPAKSVAK